MTRLQPVVAGGRYASPTAADAAMVTELHDAHGAALYDFARHLGLSDEQAADALQEAILRLWREVRRGTFIERVWDLMIQPERMAEWNSEIPEVRDITGPMDRVGGGYRQVWRFAGRRMVSKGLWQVTAVEPLRHREFRGLTPMGPMVGRDWFEPIEEGTRLTIQVEYALPWGPVARLLDPIVRAMFRRTVARNGRALTALLADEDRATP